MVNAEISWQGETPADIEAKLRAVEAALPRHLKAAAESIGNRLVGEAKEGAPVDRNNLRSSINKVVESMAGAIVSLQVGTNVPHASYQEFGTPAVFPPPSELRGWAGRVLGDPDAAYVVARSISRSGVEAQEYLQDALFENIAWMAQQVLEAVNAAFREVGLK